MPPVDPLWYKDAIIYEVHVRAFCDSTGDGVGEFRGLTQKLSYLHDLGVTAIWLLPFYPSPLRDDGYDIAAYTQVHPMYGTLEAFQEFLDAAHDLGLRVITELVLNHTSDQHPWFERARRAAPGTPERDFYVWSDSPELYPEARIIFKDFETSNWAWDSVAKSYYWHRFYSHQPDLNFDNPAVWEAIFPVVDFWFSKGVDGLRLDAVPYLYERPGTNCENLPETHAFLKALRAHIDARFPGRMLLAEANQWPEDAVAYFGDGDECQMAFHFPLMPRLFMAIHREDRLPLIDIMEQTPIIPDNCQWALFLRNHDELTLEMVTDEERDYMYEHYAADPRARINLGIRHRLAPLLGNDRRRIELMNGLLFSLPGTPVLYYGDEIGMGDNIFLGDRNGVRTPMQWSDDRNAGFSRANPQRLYLPVIIDPQYHYESVNVDTQQSNPHSLLWWTKRLIGLRRRHRAFGHGALQMLRPTNRRVLAFIRQYADESLLVLANLSRFPQHAELDLSEFEHAIPVELFGGTHFPPITQQPYPVMLGPHSFLWFELVPSQAPAPDSVELTDQHLVEANGNWRPTLGTHALGQVEDALVEHLNRRNPLSRRGLSGVRVRETASLPVGDSSTHLLFFDASCVDGTVTNHWIPVQAIVKDAVHHDSQLAAARVARLNGGAEGWLCDASSSPAFNRSLLEFICSGAEIATANQSVLSGARAAGCPAPHDLDGLPVRCWSEDGHPHATFGAFCVLSYRTTTHADGRPDYELGRWLSERNFANAPRWLASLQFQRGRESARILADVHAYVPNEGNGWQFTFEELSAFFDKMLALPRDQTRPADDSWPPETAMGDRARIVAQESASYLDSVRRMSDCIARLHLLTVTADNEPGFAPEPFTTQYQRSLYQSLRTLAAHTVEDVQRVLPSLEAPDRTRAAAFVARHADVRNILQSLLSQRITAARIRIHGNLHLGQLLGTRADFVITGFDGQGPSAAERRIKRSGLRDLAGLIHSVDFATRCALYGVGDRHGSPVGVVRDEDLQQLWDWTYLWRRLVIRTITETYTQSVSGHAKLACSTDDFDLLLRCLRLEQALDEVRHQVAAGSVMLSAAFEVLMEQLPNAPA